MDDETREKIPPLNEIVYMILHGLKSGATIPEIRALAADHYDKTYMETSIGSAIRAQRKRPNTKVDRDNLGGGLYNYKMIELHPGDAGYQFDHEKDGGTTS